jgi:methyltransferase (TIGR00027 family)
MSGTNSPIRGVADTARWVALYRALETERPDAVFRDPWARRLAGPRGEDILAAVPASARKAAWAFVARTWLFDHFILDQVRTGTTQVVNLAAGMDTRPYRLELPGGLRWVEVDQPELLAEKAAAMSGIDPVCALERISLDLADETSRQALFRRLAGEGGRVLVVTEGLLVYLSEEQVGSLAKDLFACGNVQSWLTDLMSPALLRIVQKEWGKSLRDAGAPLQFAPETGPAFFRPFGWEAADVRGAIPTARDLNRLPLLLRILSRLPGSGAFHPRRPWSGACLLSRRAGPAGR